MTHFTQTKKTLSKETRQKKERIARAQREESERGKIKIRPQHYGTIDQPARVLPLTVRRSRGRGDRKPRQRPPVAPEQPV